MYLQYWELNRYPFENVPDPNFMFYSTEHKEALVRMTYVIKRMKGAALITGEVGSGKTTLSRVLIQNLPEKEFDIGLITNPSLKPIDFLKEALLELGLETNSDSKTQILNIFNQKLMENMGQGKNTILIVDEAQIIPLETFEEIRLLLNFQLNDRFLLTVLLVGQPELADTIRKLKQLDQRIAIRYHINPLNAEETREYINFRLEKAGKREPIFNPEAIESIFHYSEGIPRKINNICDLSLLLGFTLKAREIDKSIVEKVVEDSL
ncbi:MAG: AAA family ATPase [Syntrophales bacterium]|nr:AAA family ATPase [Syntrophales bacterium]